MKRGSIVRKSVGNGSMNQDGKENRKEALRSPAKVSSKNFMSPTISAASKFTPSPRKKILGEKNDDVVRASIELFGKDSDLNSDVPNDEQQQQQQQEVVDSDVVVVKISRPLCCSPVTSSPVFAAETDPNLPPYDPKKNYLSPRPQFLRYKPNPRIEFLLKKEEIDDDDDDCEEESDVTRLEDTFNLSDTSSEEQQESETQEQETEKETEFSDVSDDSVHGSSADLSEPVSEQQKPRFLTRYKTISSVFVLLFLVACFSLSFTESPPIGLPIYEDVGFVEIYHESLRVAAFAKEKFDHLVENVKQWSMDLVSYYYLSEQNPTRKIESLQFFNLTTSPIQEEFLFNRHIGTDYIVIKPFEEEPERMEQEEDDDEDEAVSQEIDDESDVVDEVVIEEPVYEQIRSDLDEVLDEVQSVIVQNDVEIESNAAETNEKSEVLSSFSTQSIAAIFVACFSMVGLVSAVVYMKQTKSNASKAVTNRVVNNDEMCEESGSSERSISSVRKGNNNNKKKSNNKRESLASSSSEYSMNESFGSFTTFERIANKHKDEVMLTPIRRSSRLLKNQVSCS